MTRLHLVGKSCPNNFSSLTLMFVVFVSIFLLMDLQKKMLDSQHSCRCNHIHSIKQSFICPMITHYNNVCFS